MIIPEKQLSADFVVVGGGMAGICAAVAAARNGLKTVLVQDRPMLGGNASSEIRMWVCGAHGKDQKEAGILEEILLENYYLNPTLRFTVWDDVLYTVVKREPNITLLLNTTVEDVSVENGMIRSVSAWNLHSYTRYTISGRFFADCSGDSILRLSGAEYRTGREASSEFGESHAPETADKKTMGNSILIQVRKTNGPHRPFIAPEWAYHFNDDAARREWMLRDLRTDNFWWMEFGGLQDTIADADEIRDELLKIAYGCWEYIKNNPDGHAAEWELDWIGKLPGKRENIRYVGDHILTQPEVEAEGRFPDVVCHGGWSMDNHHPEAFYYPGPPTIFHPAPSPFGIPYRSLYSKNIGNLFFAGRNISCSHMAMSSTRVMATCATMGQAIGTAAALAVRHNTDPRGVWKEYTEELRDTLMEQDQFIPFAKRKISALSLAAKVSDEALRNGIDRSLGEEDNGVRVKLGDDCRYEFAKPETVRSVRIVFDSDFSDVKRMRNIEGIPENDALRRLPATLARDFRVEVLSAGKWTPVLSVKENRKRYLRLDFAPASTEAVRLVPETSWSSDADSVHVFAFEVE